MNSPFLSLPQTTRVRLSGVIWSLTQTVLGRAPSGVMPDWMVRALQLRVTRIGNVISALLLALQAGTLRTRRSPAPGGMRRSAVRTGAPTPRLPGQFGWLVKILAWHVTPFGSQLSHVLADPDMQALLAVSPRAVRTLKPLCRMLMIDLPVPPAPMPPTLPPAAAPAEAAPVRPRRPRRPRARAWSPSYNPPLAQRGRPGDEAAGAVRKSPRRMTGLVRPFCYEYVIN